MKARARIYGRKLQGHKYIYYIHRCNILVFFFQNKNTRGIKLSQSENGNEISSFLDVFSFAVKLKTAHRQGGAATIIAYVYIK